MVQNEWLQWFSFASVDALDQSVNSYPIQQSSNVRKDRTGNSYMMGKNMETSITMRINLQQIDPIDDVFTEEIH